MIVGTAGHIDHGKTSLVKALTGVDADRLKEEKARGITIDLGFAYLPLDDGTVRIEALVPESELARYVLDLRSITGGRAELTMEPDHYDILPSHLVPA